MAFTVKNLEAEYMSVSQAATILSITPPRIRQLIQEGRLPFIRTPLGKLIRRDAVEAEVARRGHA